MTTGQPLKSDPKHSHASSKPSNTPGFHPCFNDAHSCLKYSSSCWFDTTPPTSSYTPSVYAYCQTRTQSVPTIPKSAPQSLSVMGLDMLRRDAFPKSFLVIFFQFSFDRSRSVSVMVAVMVAQSSDAKVNATVADILSARSQSPLFRHLLVPSSSASLVAMTESLLLQHPMGQVGEPRSGVACYVLVSKSRYPSTEDGGGIGYNRSNSSCQGFGDCLPAHSLPPEG
ncbi:hypothetical protein BKA57DRAFT_522838 [Linnemannia elongata]|nr:hypothetical protein BKA57DRAFT_525315 [Linnemannia elongata]KAH7056677.1 hypothetical protein BKA57DRAFT_522838 [Linnemannia elongata]